MFTTKKKFAIVVIVVFALIPILAKNYIIEVSKTPSIRANLINIAQVAIPLKNLILFRNIDDKIASLKSSGSCVFCDLTQGDFKGSDLKGVDLRYAILIGANLSNANLNGANLHHANLSGANLNGVDLSDNDLTGINLSGVNLSNTNFTGSIMRYVNLSKANLYKANLHHVNLTDANLGGANLIGANLAGANLKGVDLSNKDLTGVDLYNASFVGANLRGVDLSNKDLTGTNLSGVDLSNTNMSGAILTLASLSGANLRGVDLSNKDLTGTNLSGVDLSNTNMSGAILTLANLSGANLRGVDLSNKDLTGTNLSGVDLSNKDLTGAILTFANLSGVNLRGVDLSNKDLTGTNLSGVDLSNTNMSGVTLKDAKKIEINLKNPSNLNWSELNGMNVTRYDLNGEVQYLGTKEGLLYEFKNNELKLVLDLNKNTKLPFDNSSLETGLLGIASKNKLVYVSYTTKVSNELHSLVVNEYSLNFSKVRNIIKIDGFQPKHFGGSLLFDNLGELYLSVGDGNKTDDFVNNDSQNLNSLRGKILRLNLLMPEEEPEILAYGIRNPWGVTIDSNNRMFILQCGQHNVEAVYLLNDLYSDNPVNFGWPVFEGSTRIRKEDSLMFKDVLAPIFEYNNRPGCITGGVYLDNLEALLIADFYGTIRLLKEKENGEWYLLYEEKEEAGIWGFGFEKKTNKIFVAPKNLELEISVDKVKLNQ